MTPYESYWQARKQGYGTPELEATIATDSEYSYLYANEIIKGRWEPGETIITTDAYYSEIYARYVIKGRWEPGEAIITTNAHYSYCYAIYAIKGRFPLGEPVISKSEYWKNYLNDVPMTDDERAWLFLRYGAPK